MLHTGDFKMDQLPLDERITDLRAFARLGEEGVDLFLPDSTNADVPGFTPFERDIGPVLESVIAKAKRRVIVASFSSHVHRVQQVLDAAVANGRQVALVGRSMVRNMGIAADLGYLKVPDGVLVDLKKAATCPTTRSSTCPPGSQGEPMAVLARMANLEHQIEIGEGDTVILASSLIPGNENAVYRVINGLTKLGAKVVHKGNAKVHVSGHAAAGELLYCYNILRRGTCCPCTASTATSPPTPRSRSRPACRRRTRSSATTASSSTCATASRTVVGQLDLGYVYVDGSTVGEITDADLKDRRILAEEGFISIFVAIDKQTGRVIVGPEIQARGFAEDERVFDDVLPQIVQALTEAAENGTRDSHGFQQVDPPHRRPLGQHPAPPSPDDHPGRRVRVRLESDAIRK